MELTSPKTIKEIFSKYDVLPSKGLGQNFLIDKNILEKIIDSSDIKPTDTILEVGPGIGTLTIELAKRAKKVIAIEKDKKMCEILQETLKDYKNIEIINKDILRYQFPAEAYKVVANIPYYLTSPLIRILLENKNRPEEIILMIQKEVAKRICSKPPDMSILSVSVQFYADAKIISYVSKNCFLPVPKVDSALIKIMPAEKQSADKDLFFKIVKAGFSHPRKQLINNLADALKLKKEKVENWLIQAGIEPTRRAETLEINDWLKMTELLKNSPC